MTEKEKKAQGQWYHPMDKEVFAEIMHAKKLLHDFNSLAPDQYDYAHEILVSLLGGVGEGSNILSPFICDYGYNIRLGQRVFINHNAIFLDSAPIIIGDDVLIAPGVHLYTVGHPLDADLRKSGVERGRPIIIGNNVWIGGNVTVVPGITIGDNAVIGAGSVVTKDVPGSTLWAGNPAKNIRDI